jgi:hypothetical protein
MVPPEGLPELPVNEAAMAVFAIGVLVLSVFGALNVRVGTVSPTVISAAPQALLEDWLSLSPEYDAYHQ